MGLKPAFITGANAKVVVGDKILAFASDVNFNVNVTVIPIEVLGRIEILTYEPVAYSASGSMSIMRYTGDMIKNAGLAGTSALAGKDAMPGNATHDIAQDYALFGAHLSVENYMISTTFDMVVYINNQTDTSGANWIQVYTMNDCRLTSRGNALTKRGVMVDAYNFVATHVTDASTNPALIP